MSKSLLIEGTTQPAAGVLARGEQKWVADSPRIQGLVSGGFIRILEEVEHGDEPEELVPTNDEGGTPLQDRPEVEPPKKNATTEEWYTFVEQNIPGVTIPEGATRDQLIGAWEAYVQQVDGGS